MYRQAKWDEPLLFDLSEFPKVGVIVDDEFGAEAKEMVKELSARGLIRSKLDIPDLSEVEVVRHFMRLSQMSYGVDVGPVPLGSCTMKYNPKISEELASRDEITLLHPYQDEDTVQGILEIMYTMQKWFAEITGTDVCSLQPPAGASGEFVGALIIRKYHEDRGEPWRNEMIIPESAHGTNPASAVMAGFKVINIPTDSDGNTDLNALKHVLSSKTAGIMLTNPSTLGLFESKILEIAREVHKAGGLLYYDGANLNGIMGIVRPGDMGFDIIHLNLHKTFSTPHGAGGPGAGAICVKGFLKDYIPVPIVEYNGRKYYFKYDIPKSIGRISWFYGNIIPIVKAFIYISMLGPALREVAEISVLNTNYLMKKLTKLKGVDLIYGKSRWRKHEVVVSLEKLYRETGVNAEDVAKALLDEGIHAPTIYFPLIVPEAHMIELTESEPIEVINRIAKAYEKIIRKSYENPREIKESPKNTSIDRLDPMIANHPRTLTPSYKFINRLLKNLKKSLDTTGR